MDRRFWTVLGASLALGLLISVLFYSLASRAGRKPPPVERKQVVVATHALPAGSSVPRDGVRLLPIAAEAFPQGGFSRLEEVVDRPVAAAILENEAVVEARLAPRGSGGGLAPMIPPGMRAVAVRVNEVVGVAGFVLPGMRVDVLVTGRPPGREETVTTTVLQNIVVLSAGQNTQADKAQPINTPVVTLLVTPAQAEILTLASNEGRIHLVLRNGSDQTVAPTRGLEVRELFGTAWNAREPVAAARRGPLPQRPPAARPEPLPPALPAPAAPPPPHPEIIRGTQKTREVPGGSSGS